MMSTWKLHEKFWKIVLRILQFQVVKQIDYRVLNYNVVEVSCRRSNNRQKIRHNTILNWIRAMAEEEIKEMKEIIKAIMSSCGTYCSLRQLKRHYGDQTGENIEDTVQKVKLEWKFFHEFFFFNANFFQLRAISLMEFLTTECQQICNVVQKNGDYRLYRISTEKSRHLDNLTKSGQKRWAF